MLVVAHVVVPHALSFSPLFTESAFESLVPSHDGLFRVGEGRDAFQWILSISEKKGVWFSGYPSFEADDDR